MRVKYMTPLCPDGEADLGFIFRGPLILYDDPRTPREAATKRYVDNKLGNLDAGSLSGGVIDVSTLPAFSGDVIMEAGNNVIELTPTGVIAGTYTKVTVDSKGRVVHATNLSQIDIPQLSWSKIVKNKPTTLEGYGIQDALSLSGGVVGPGFGISSLPQEELHIINRSYFNQKLGELNILPIGSIVEFPTINSPDGFLKANGALVSKTTYSELYSIIGNKFSKLRMQLGYGRPWEQQYDPSGDLSPPQLEELELVNSYPFNKYGDATTFSTSEHMYLMGNSVRPDIGTIQILTDVNPDNYNSFEDMAIYEGDGTVDDVREIITKPLPDNTPFIHVTGNGTGLLLYTSYIYLRSIPGSNSNLTILGGGRTISLPTSYSSWVTNRAGYEEHIGNITSMFIDLNGSSFNISGEYLSRGSNFNQSINVSWSNLGVLFTSSLNPGTTMGIGHGTVSATGTLRLNGFHDSTTNSFGYTLTVNSFSSSVGSGTYSPGGMSISGTASASVGGQGAPVTSAITVNISVNTGNGTVSRTLPTSSTSTSAPASTNEVILLPSKNQGKTYGVYGAGTAVYRPANPAIPTETRSAWSSGARSIFKFPRVDDAINTGSYLPIPVLNSTPLLIKDRAYMLGGEVSGVPVNAIQYSDIRTDGWNKPHRFSKWKGTGSLPEALSRGAAFWTGDKVYYIGGRTVASMSNKIYSAKLNPDGSLGNWSLEGLLPVSIYGHSLCILGSVVYIVGGTTPSGDSVAIYRSEISPTGTIEGFELYDNLTNAPGESSIYVTDRGFLLLGTEYEIRGLFDEKKNLTVDSYRRSDVLPGSSRRLSSYKGRLIVVDSTSDQTTFKRYGSYPTKNFERSWYDDSYPLNISNQDGFHLPDFESSEEINDYYIKY